MEPNKSKGFQSRYYTSPFYRRLIVGRDLAEEEFLKKTLDDSSQRDRSPPKQSVPQEDKPSLEKLTSQKLNRLVEQSKDPLLKVKTSIPFNPFPHSIIVDLNKVTIIYRYFFFSEQIHSVFVKDISDVLVETSWFFSTLKIIDVGFTENSIDINYLSTEDAILARKVIQGLIVAHKHGLDLARYQESDLAQKLEQLGKAERAI